jgi:hypothetical protein
MTAAQIEAFEREAGQMAGRRGHAAGRSGARRDIVRDAGGATRQRHEPHKTGRPIPSRRPADRQPPVDVDEVRTYNGIAAEKPGPFESASFLSQPTKLPKDLT